MLENLDSLIQSDVIDFSKYGGIEEVFLEIDKHRKQELAWMNS